MKKTVSILLSLILMLSMMFGNCSYDSIQAATDTTITRAEWIHSLVTTFEMEVDETNIPDNYFNDIDESTQYYEDIMKAVAFGVVDIEAGKAFEPTKAVTREFAAHTLNFCLGFQLKDDNTYSFSDSASCEYAVDAQVAVNRGWFSLSSGKFMPNNQITSAESTKMINDAVTVKNQNNVSENYNSTWNVSSGVKEIPYYTDVTIEGNQVKIIDSPQTISRGDTFVVYQGEIAVPFKAVNVGKSGNVTTITTEDVDNYGDAFDEVDAEGVIESDELTFEALDGTDLEIEIKDDTEGISRARATKKIKDAKFSKSFKLSGNLSSSIKGTFSNIKVKYNVSTGSGETFVQVEGDLSMTGSITATAGTSVNILKVGIPGVGGVTLSADLKAEGKLNSTITSHVVAGLSYSKSGGFRTIRSFKENGGSNTSTEATATMGATLKCGITDMKVISGYVYGKAGVKAQIVDTSWETGQPRNCKTFLAYMYASYGAEASCKFVNYKYSKNVDVYNLSNSPMRVYHHYEDGRQVAQCTRGMTFEYFTKYYSAYWGSGWSGCDSSYGLDGEGKPYAVYEYEIKTDSSKNQYAVLTKYRGNMRNLAVPETLDGYKVTKIGNDAFGKNNYLQILSIPDCITEIGTGVFIGCSNLSDVTLSKGLTKMGGYAFGDCDSLTSIEIPKSLKETTTAYYLEYLYDYHYGVFIASDNLKNVTFERGATEVAKGLFANNNSLENITIPDTVVKIGDNAFENCTNLKNVSLGKSVTKIGGNAFRNVKRITSIHIPDTVTEIGTGAFIGCSNLSDVTLSKGLTKMGGYAFGDCDSLTSIEIPKSLKETTTAYYPEYLYDYHYGVFIASDNLKNVTFERGATEVAKGLFANNTSLENITIPDTVVKIGDNAFENCTNLKNVSLGKSVTKIGGNAFRNVKGITSIHIPDTVTEIGTGAFIGCSNLSDVTLSKGLTKMGGYAFGDCDSLTSIEIPKSLKETTTAYYPEYLYDYHYGVFIASDNLKNVTFERGATEVAKGLFANNNSLENITIPDTVVKIGDNAFENCTNLKNVSLGKSVTKIGGNAFRNVKGITSIHIPDTVTEIGTGAFIGCSNLSDVTLSKGLTKMGGYAFGDCDSLTSIEIPKSLKETTTAYYPEYLYDYHYGVFIASDNLKNVTFERGATEVAKGLFANNNSLENITIPDTVVKIGDNAFESCASLKTINLSKKLETIGSNAFQNANGLEKIDIPDTVISMGEYVFSGCSHLANVKLPSTRQNISSHMFYNCTSLKNIELPDTVVYVRECAFENSGLEHIKMSPNVTTIENYAFRNTPLQSVEFSGKEETIGKEVFYNCDALTKITVPDSVTSMGSSVFKECDALVDVHLGTGIKTIPSNSFEHCDALGKILIPYNVTKIENNAFANCVAFTDITIPRATTIIESSAFSYPSRMTVTGIAGTYAETFAAEQGMKFVNKEVKATDAIISESNVTLNKNSTKQLSINVTPNDFTDLVSWKSTDTNVVTVDNSGMIKAISNGTATIKVTVGNVSATCNVTVVQPVTSIWLNKSSLALDGGETGRLMATVNPDNANNKEVQWSTSDSSVATVDNQGNVKAVAKGTTTIKVEAKDGSGTYDTCTVTVRGVVNQIDDIDNMQSPHPYNAGCTDSWVYRLDGAEALSVSFDALTELEDGFDYLYIFDADNNQIGQYTGTQLSGKTITLKGNEIRVKIESDDGGNAYGFKVNSVKSISLSEVNTSGGLLDETTTKPEINSDANSGTEQKVQQNKINPVKGTAPQATKIKKLKGAKKSLKVTWIKRKNVKGYQIQYSISKKFKKSKKITINKAKVTSRTIKKLKVGRKYYVRIRTYILANGKKYYSKWSKAKSKKVK